MFRAFDTKLLQVMSTIVHCDELHIIQMLIHNTTLEVKLATNSPQVLKLPSAVHKETVYHQYCLLVIWRWHSKNLDHAVNTMLLADYPNETAYADDVDFISTNRTHQEKIGYELVASVASWTIHKSVH